jgi:hypothetical protein
MSKVSIAALLILLSVAACARVAVEGGEKPIHIVLDVNVRVARELDNFFDFEDKHPVAASQPQGAAAVTTTTHPN